MAAPHVLASALITLIVFIVSSLPLYFAVKFLKGRTTVLKAVVVSLLMGIIVSAIKFRFHTLGSLIAFFISVWIYHEVFRLRWWKSFILWFVVFVFILIMELVVAIVTSLILGIAFVSLLM